MADNIIYFPLHRKNFPVTEEVLSKWSEGLLHSSYEEQWRTFEQMTSFSDIHVIQLAQKFLTFELGEPLLKTKLLQVLKNTCPSSLTFQVHKFEQMQQVTLGEVPLQWEDWSPDLLAPLHLLQDKAYADPSLVEMAKELWIYFLEKFYPIHPPVEDNNLWAAGLHIFTLKAINEELAEIQGKEEIPKLYSLSNEEVQGQFKQFEICLKANERGR